MAFLAGAGLGSAATAGVASGMTNSADEMEPGQPQNQQSFLQGLFKMMQPTADPNMLDLSGLWQMK